MPSTLKRGDGSASATATAAHGVAGAHPALVDVDEDEGAQSDEEAVEVDSEEENEDGADSSGGDGDGAQFTWFDHLFVLDSGTSFLTCFACLLAFLLTLLVLSLPSLSIVMPLHRWRHNDMSTGWFLVNSLLAQPYILLHYAFVNTNSCPHDFSNPEQRRLKITQNYKFPLTIIILR